MTGVPRVKTVVDFEGSRTSGATDHTWQSLMCPQWRYEYSSAGRQPQGRRTHAP